uniref:Predicted protein n=1 Tax=Hordeum vulgare subsp. vulgare TaxID=112509 RepID=F2E5V3_HORVV|nr:predicted protein [Hordeum vulgare subsp. vulgare]
MSLNHYKVKKLIIDRVNQSKIKKENLDYIVSEFMNLQYLWIANNQLDHFPHLS